MKILIAYDGSPAAKAAVQETLARSWPSGTQVRLVTVVEWPAALELPVPEGPGPAVEKFHALLTEKVQRSLGEALKNFSSRSDLDVSSEVLEGSPKQALLDAIEKWNPDLVMTGSTGKSGLKG